MLLEVRWPVTPIRGAEHTTLLAVAVMGRLEPGKIVMVMISTGKHVPEWILPTQEMAWDVQTVVCLMPQDAAVTGILVSENCAMVLFLKD
ncbi:MAG: hypothetical protein AAGF11_06100 [Myxococcota bacterium]